MKQTVLGDGISTIEGFLTQEECKFFIEKSERIGYEPATVETEKGPVRIETVRNNNRIIFSDPDLAISLWEKARSFSPKKIGNSTAIELNEMFRFYKYEPGQQFRKHKDQSYIRNDSEASYYTILIYLNDDYSGGETAFNEITVNPRTGTALIFRHDLEHRGSEVTSGVKYILRTDIMFSLQAPEE
ncbi:MAG: 2OG-Fe(II) oxygenase [Puia sp.]|nr:2OG-Fe(II) oxygenase [Puia sp.]